MEFLALNWRVLILEAARKLQFPIPLKNCKMLCILQAFSLLSRQLTEPPAALVGFCGACPPAVNLPKNHDLWAAVNLSFYESELLQSFGSMEESKVKSPHRRRLIGDFLCFLREAQQTPSWRTVGEQVH
jgi:hypothetical protein